MIPQNATSYKNKISSMSAAYKSIWSNYVKWIYYFMNVQPYTG